MNMLNHPRLLLSGLLAVLAMLLNACSNSGGGDPVVFGSLDNLYRITPEQTRSISPENFTGEKGKAAMSTDGPAKNAARELGQGWKVSPFVIIKAKTTFTLAEITGPGCIRHIWMTPTGNWRHSIIRFYWDDETEPSIECPVGDFFACGLGQYCQNNSVAICVNPGSAFNCYWPMPFRKKARVTMENIDDKQMVVYYQIDYALTRIPADAGYLHTQFRRENPLNQKGLFTIVDGVKGKGQYVGTYLAWTNKAPGWWGEGEIKFYIDGDKQFPTIAGTGTEDYFCGSYDFERQRKTPDGKVEKYYQVFSTPYTGLVQVIPPDKIYVASPQDPQKFGLYRWHITDPVRFDKDLKVTIQALGWQSGGRYLPLEDDIASTCFWYQTEPHAPLGKLPPREKLD